MSKAGIRLTLRQKPHLDFVIGYPGLVPDGETKQASLEGSVEVRVQNPVYTKWLKVELKKTETVQTNRGIRKYFELIGSNEQMLWNGGEKEASDKEDFAPLDTSDHSFVIPIPPGLPPTIVLDKSKNTGIVYHLVATAMIKVKSKGLFGGSSNHFKPPTVITQISEVTIEKHELNPSWPIYTWQAESTPLLMKQANLSLQLKRETVIYGGNDPVKLDVEIKSERNAPVKITRIEMQLKEIVTSREADAITRGGPPDPKKILQQSYDILSLKSPCQNVLYQNESMSHSLSSVFPPTHHHFTVQNAKHIEVKYAMRIRVVVEVPKEAKAKKGETRVKEAPIKEIVLDNVPVIISPWSKKQSEWWRTKIGHIPQNLQRPTAIPVPSSAAPMPQQQSPSIQPAASPPTLPSTASPSVSRPSGYSSSPAALASRTFSQRVQQGNQQASGTNGQTYQPVSAPSLQAIQPQQIAPAPQAQHMTAEPSNEERRALAIEQGKRLSSWPPPPRGTTSPMIAVTAPDSHSDSQRPDQLQDSRQYPSDGYHGQKETMPGRQTRSESGHGTMHWQPSREVTSLDGHSAAFRSSQPPQPYQMNGAYPMAKSASLSQGMSTMGYANPWSPPTFASHRRVFSDGGQQMRQSSHPSPGEPSSSSQDRRLSTPLLSSSIPINTRRSSTDVSNGTSTPKQRMHIDIAQGGFPTRKNTLSTITGSAPSSQQSSPTYETQTVPMPQTDWSSAEEEKERLYNEAVDRARRTQERAGNTIGEPEYRSVQDRTPTPLSLMRSMSNPTPSKQDQHRQNMQNLAAPIPVHHNRFSTTSTHLGYLNTNSDHGSSQEDLRERTPDETEYQSATHAYNPTDGFDPSTTRRASLQLQRNQRQETDPMPRQEQSISALPPLQKVQSYPQAMLSPLSPSMSWSGASQLDAQKMAYLKALAAREAYQQRIAGTQPEPLTALEEKQRLQRLFEEEEQKAGRGGEEAQSLSTSQAPPLPELPAKDVYRSVDEEYAGNASYEDSQARYQREFTPASSVYLTPDTTQGGRWQPRSILGNGNGNHNPYFESPNSSMTHLPSDGSSLSHNYKRNPSISKGKQRRHSTYRSSENDHHPSYLYDEMNGNSSTSLSTPPLPPTRPPKGRDIIHDTYKQFDTPVSSSAEDYERKLLWGRSQSSHHGH